MPPNMSESPPCKKLRLGDSKPDVHLPLRIDTDRARSVRSPAKISVSFSLSLFFSLFFSFFTEMHVAAWNLMKVDLKLLII